MLDKFNWSQGGYKKAVFNSSLSSLQISWSHKTKWLPGFFPEIPVMCLALVKSYYSCILLWVWDTLWVGCFLNYLEMMRVSPFCMIHKLITVIYIPKRVPSQYQVVCDYWKLCEMKGLDSRETVMREVKDENMVKSSLIRVTFCHPKKIESLKFWAITFCICCKKL